MTNYEFEAFYGEIARCKKMVFSNATKAADELEISLKGKPALFIQ